MTPRRYRRRPDQAVSAVQLNLETDGLRYRKWGAEQRANQGDYLVDNAGEVYTVARASFERTYRNISPGRFLKVTPIWAQQATRTGALETLEGATHYVPGDYLVSNAADGSDQYAIEQSKFEAMYEPDDEGDA